MLLAKQLSELHTAKERKDVKLHQDSLKRFLGNRQEREMYEKRKKYVDKQEKQHLEAMQSSQSLRLSQAEGNIALLLQQRNQQLEDKHRAEASKAAQAKQAQKQKEAEMEAWRAGLLRHTKMMENRATETVSKSIEQRVMQVKKDRLIKEQEQKKNISKIHKEVERWRTGLEKSLCQKDKKVDDLLAEKEKIIAETRAMAAVSQTMRDDVRERYVSDSFDKKALEAQLYSSLQRAKSPSRKNTSTYKIY